MTPQLQDHELANLTVICALAAGDQPLPPKWRKIANELIERCRDARGLEDKSAPFRWQAT